MTTTKLTRRTLLKQGIARLKESPEVAQPGLEALELLGKALEVDREEIYRNLDAPVTATQAACYQDLLQRRLQGEPLQYITGFQDFMGLKFRVCPDVLIPRSDTETLVEWAVELLRREKFPFPPRVADVGTGSGAIAISIAKLVPGTEVWATEIDGKALEVARENARRLNASVRFCQGDMLAPLVGKKFHLIVSNPPYIPRGKIAQLPVSVREHEPLLALDGGEDGLLFYRRLAEEAPLFLFPGGYLLVEIGYNQRQAVEEIFLQAGFCEVTSRRDLAGRERCVGGYWPGA